MAKREANTQLTKDGGVSEDDGFSVGAQVGGGPRATAAQMAARKLAKPRGGRRPGTPGQARHPNAPNVPFTQTQPSLFQPNNSNSTNGTQEQQSGFGSSNGSQSNQTSQSFPPFGSGSHTGINTRFTAPSGGFSFSAGQSSSVNNPFANTPPPSTAGFSGSIFSLPAQKSGLTSYQKFCEGEQPPLFAAHSPFHDGNQTAATPDHSQASNNAFDVSASQQQQQPSQQGSSLFPQQQASGNMFAQQQPPTAAKNLFRSLKQPQPQTSNNSFGQGNSPFEQSQPAQRTTNLFAHVDAQQPSTDGGQEPTPPAAEDYSMMSTSPDTSPQTTPSGTLNGSNAQSQSSPTKDNTSPGAGLSLLDRVSSPLTQPSTQPFWTLNKEASAPGAGGSVFDNVAKPTIEASAAPPSNSTQPVSPFGGVGSLFERITKPPTEASTKSPSTSDTANYPEIPHASDTSEHPMLPEDPQPAKKKLFGHSLAAQAVQLPSTSKSSVFAPKNLNNFSQPTIKAAQDASNVSSSTVGNPNASSNGQAMASKKRKFGAPPEPFEGCTEDERIQLVTGWRLKMHDAGLQKRLRSNPSENEKAMLMKFYRMREQEIKAAKAGPLPGAVPGSKRKAAEEQHIDEAQGKKAKFADVSHDLHGTLSNGTSTTSSQTSSMFKDILGTSKGRNTMVNGIGGAKNTVHYPLLPSSSNDSSKPPPFPTTLSTASSIPPPPESTAEDQSKSLAFPGTPYQPPVTGFGVPNSPGSSGLFSLKPTSSSGSPSDTATPSAFQTPKFGASAPSIQGNPSTFPTSSQSSSHPSASATKAVTASEAPIFVSSTAPTLGTPNSFQFKPANSSDSIANVSNPSALKVPTFGAGPATNFLSQFGKVAEKSAEEAKQKRKLEEYDSDEEDERTWERKDEEKQRAKKQKLEELAKSKTAKMVNGKWQLVATSSEELASIDAPKEKPVGSSLSIFDQPRVPLTNGHNIFGHLSGEDSGAEGSKTGDADDEDDGQDDGQDNQENEGENGNGEELQEEKTNAQGREKASSNPFQTRLSRAASPQRNATSPSMFDRISKDGNGKLIGNNSKPDEKLASVSFGQHGAGLGSGFSTSISFGKSAGEASDPKTNKSSSTSTTNLFGQQSTSSGPATVKTSESQTANHTWKADSPIKFGNQSNTPAVNVTAPSPSKSPFTGLFGASKTNATIESPSKPASSLFITSPTKAPTTGFGFGFGLTPANTAKPVEPATESSPPPSDAVPTPKPTTSLFTAPPNNTSSTKPTTNFFPSFNNIASSANPTVRSLAPPSTNASGATSRATSPGATTGESANESNADNDERSLLKDDQVDLMSARPGEENEDILFEVKAKAMTYDAAAEGGSKWVVKGVGPLRVMKHRVTGNTRLLLRAEPSGKIAVNAHLLKDMTYESTSAKAIRVPIANATGKIDVYNFKVGKDDDAKELANILLANRPS